MTFTIVKEKGLGKWYWIALSIAIPLVLIYLIWPSEDTLMLAYLYIMFVCLVGFIVGVVKTVLGLLGQKSIEKFRCDECAKKYKLSEIVTSSTMISKSNDNISRVGISPAGGLSYGKQGLGVNLGAFGMRSETPGILGKFELELSCPDDTCVSVGNLQATAEIRIWNNLDGTHKWELKEDYKIH